MGRLAVVRSKGVSSSPALASIAFFRMIPYLRLAVFTTFAGLVGPTASFSASILPLGDLPGGTLGSVALGISGDGSVVVGFANSTLGSEPFQWTATGGMIGLGDLPGGRSDLGSANRMSFDGTIVVGNSASTAGTEAFRWTAGTGMVGLGDFVGGRNRSAALDVSADGTVIVGYGESIRGTEAFRWTSAKGIVGLGDFVGGQFWSSAAGISADGNVVVGFGAVEEGNVAFRWTAETGLVSLGEFPGGTFSSLANGVSADGNVVVGHSTSAEGVEAFRWTAADGLMSLGKLPGGSYLNYAYTASADGSVVVGQAQSSVAPEAFVWTARSGIRRLWDELVLRGVDPAASGWSILQEANSISHDGCQVAGYGQRNGNLEAFLADLTSVLKYRQSGTGLELIWSGSQSLQFSPSLSPQGWVTVPGAVSPYEVPLDGPLAFYRLGASTQ